MVFSLKKKTKKNADYFLCMPKCTADRIGMDYGESDFRVFFDPSTNLIYYLSTPFSTHPYHHQL